MYMRSAGMRGSLHSRLDTEDIPEKPLIDDVFRYPGSHYFAVLHDDQFITEHGCMIEVMQRDNARDRQTGDKFEQTHLMLNIQMVRWLVKNEFFWLLR